MTVQEAQPKKVISMSTLGSNGRFGNQVFQYAFLRIYAKKYGLGIQTSKWIGQYLFDHSDPEVDGALKGVNETEFDFLKSVEQTIDAPLYNADLWGYFLHHTSHYRPYKSYFLSLFEPLPEIREDIEKKLEKLKQECGTLIGMHLRRGDFGYGDYFIPPNKWYKKWLSELWGVVPKPSLFIASDEPSRVVRDFRSYNPVTASDLGALLPEAEFYPDFFILSQCDALAISNSTFSFAASMLNTKGEIFSRPDCNEKRLVSFDPWDGDPLMRYSGGDIGLEFGQKLEILKGKIFNRLAKL